MLLIHESIMVFLILISAITWVFFLHFLVICRDEEGRIIIIKDNEGWQASPCVKCHCKGANMSCQKTLTVFFPAYSFGAYETTETCEQPSCNIRHFLKYSGYICQGMI